MRLLLDECLPRKLKRSLAGHEVRTVAEAGWAGKKNGELLRLAEGRFDVFVTVDRNLGFQQALERLKFAVIVLVAVSNSIEELEPLMTEVLRVLPDLRPGQVVRVG